MTASLPGQLGVGMAAFKADSRGCLQISFAARSRRKRYFLPGTGGGGCVLAAIPSLSSKRAASAYAKRIRERLPRRLQELREAKGLSQYELWRKCGVSRNTISYIESGKRLPGVEVLAVLVRGLGVTLEGFFSGMEEGQKAFTM